MKVKGKRLDMNKTYTFIACERDGDPDTTICRVENVKAPQLLGATLHKVIEEYLAKHLKSGP